VWRCVSLVYWPPKAKSGQPPAGVTSCDGDNRLRAPRPNMPITSYYFISSKFLESSQLNKLKCCVQNSYKLPLNEVLYNKLIFLTHYTKLLNPQLCPWSE
jgi:hypothetical protein